MPRKVLRCVYIFRHYDASTLFDTEHHVFSSVPYNLDPSFSNSTLFVQVPTFSRLTSTTSPSFIHSLGFRPIPTPEGVPVNIMSPGSSVVPRLRKEIVCLTLNI